MTDEKHSRNPSVSDPLDQIERDIAAGRIASINEHNWMQKLSATTRKSNPSVFQQCDYFIVLSHAVNGELCIEIASFRGDEGGFLCVSEIKAEIKYDELVSIGDAVAPKKKMMRVCRDSDGNHILVFGKGEPAEDDDARTFTEIRAKFVLNKSTKFQIGATLAKYRHAMRIRSNACDLMASSIIGMIRNRNRQRSTPPGEADTGLSDLFRFLSSRDS